MKEMTEYEIEKKKHKRLLVRNEFQVIGKYDIPIVHKQQIDMNYTRSSPLASSTAAQANIKNPRK